MIRDTIGREPRRKLNGAELELDALVAREVDALSADRPRPDSRRRAPTGDHSDPRPAAATREQDSAAPGRPADGATSESNVIGLRRAARPDGASGLGYSPEEEGFLEQAVAFLQGRENADVLLEELWATTVIARNDSMDDAIDDESILAEEAAEPDVEMEPPHDAIAGGFSDAPAVEHRDPVAGIKPVSAKPRPAASSGSETAGSARPSPGNGKRSKKDTGAGPPVSDGGAS
jgi:hypothetical protein